MFLTVSPPSRFFSGQSHPGYELARIMADSNAQLGITTNADGDGSPSSSFPVQATPVVVDSVNDLDKDFGSAVATQVRKGPRGCHCCNVA